MEATALAKHLERIELPRAGTKSNARRRIAGKLRIALCTFENIIYGRIKRIDATLRDNLSAALTEALENQIAGLTHDLELHRQGRATLTSDKIAAVEDHIAQALAILKQGKKP